jgi:hypothetical protein
MRPPMLPIADTTDRYRHYVNGTAASKVPARHLRHLMFFPQANRLASLLSR